ncbi:uncharacterized protein [Elaeis guineensis]|uniref:uncharacterized protein n=1 Tax=Elaeis guineensis var. tenera TaxID=51953 RepID=UPI003C6DA78C
MAPSKTIKEVQHLISKIASLNRFVFRSAERCLSFFKTLKQPRDFQWTTKCQKAFKELKQYLSSPPLPSKPQSGELFLYIAISPVAIGSILIQKEGQVQRPIYHTNKILHDAKTRYSKLEKLIFALVVTMRKLQPYLQAHTYRPRPSIKAQVLADFIFECTIPNGEGARATGSSKKGKNSGSNESSRGEEVDIGSNPEKLWTLHVDGSSSAMRAGAGLILTRPERKMARYALRFDFPAINNEAEYKALLSDLRVAKKRGPSI